MQRVTRRAAFRLTGRGLLAGLLAGRTEPRAAFGAGGLMAGEQIGDAAVPEPANKLLRAFFRRRNTRRDVQVGHVDADIAGLRSVAPVMKARMQEMREEADDTLRDKLERGLF